ncbi:MAG: hypothetical protein WCC60_21290 [Ilumatobacteraceae bacterium]
MLATHVHHHASTVEHHAPDVAGGRGDQRVVRVDDDTVVGLAAAHRIVRIQRRRVATECLLEVVFERIEADHQVDGDRGAGGIGVHRSGGVEDREQRIEPALRIRARHQADAHALTMLQDAVVPISEPFGLPERVEDLLQLHTLCRSTGSVEEALVPDDADVSPPILVRTFGGPVCPVGVGRGDPRVEEREVVGIVQRRRRTHQRRLAVGEVFLHPLVGHHRTQRMQLRHAQFARFGQRSS